MQRRRQRRRRVLDAGSGEDEHDAGLWGDAPLILHLKQRRLVQPAFHRERIAGYATTMVEASRRAADALRPGETVAVDAVMNKLALRIAAAIRGAR